MMKMIIELLSGMALLLLALAIGYGLWLLIRIPTNRWRATAFDFVYVNDDGSVRTLDKKEEARLSSLFFVGDSPDFYIKPRYESLNPSGQLSGYIKRRVLPKHVDVQLPVNNQREG
jgi:hypothetical protein